MTAKNFLSNSLICAFVLFSGLKAHAQTDSLTNASNSNIALSLSVQPLFFVNSAIKLDLEIQQPNRRFGYVISPEIYSSNITDTSIPEPLRNQQSDEIRGFGLGIQQKIKFKKQVISPYLAYGATYRNQTITYSIDGFAPTEEGGLQYYHYGPINSRNKVNSVLINTVLGFQTLDWDVLIADIYVGFGYKLADVKMERPGERQYNKSMISPAYKGVTALFGIKLGAQLRK